MQRVTIIGNLGADAVIREVGNNKKALNFSVAHTQKFKNKEGVETEKTTWWDCVIWKNNDQSTEIAKYLKKGSKVLVEGEPEVKPYTNKEGNADAYLGCTVKTIELLVVKDSEPQNTQS